MKRTCSICNEEKELESFNLRKRAKLGRDTRCSQCMTERQKDYRDTNPNKSKEYKNKYKVKNNKELLYRLRNLIYSSRTRAAKFNREHTLTVEDLVDIYPIDNKCPVFGFDLEWNTRGFSDTSPTLDRRDSTKGYTKENVQIISWKANRFKNNATVTEIEALLAFMKQE